MNGKALAMHSKSNRIDGRTRSISYRRSIMYSWFHFGEVQNNEGSLFDMAMVATDIRTQS